MIPTLIVLGLVVGRWWRTALVVGALGWPVALLTTNVMDLEPGCLERPRWGWSTPDSARSSIRVRCDSLEATQWFHAAARLSPPQSALGAVCRAGSAKCTVPDANVIAQPSADQPPPQAKPGGQHTVHVRSHPGGPHRSRNPWLLTVNCATSIDFRQSNLIRSTRRWSDFVGHHRPVSLSLIHI